MAELIFFIAGTGAIAGALGVVILRNPFYAVLSLVFHLLNLAALFLLLRAEFLAAAQVAIYAGGVMVLYIFVVAYIGADSATRMQPLGGPGLRALSLLVGALLSIQLMIALLGTGLQEVQGDGAQWDPAYGTPQQIGELLLTKFLLPFEVASFLLLIAAVGAVVLGRRRPEAGDPVPGAAFVAQKLPQGTGSMKEGTGYLNPTGTMNVVAQASPELKEVRGANADLFEIGGSSTASNVPVVGEDEAAGSGEDGGGGA